MMFTKRHNRKHVLLILVVIMLNITVMVLLSWSLNDRGVYVLPQLKVNGGMQEDSDATYANYALPLSSNYSWPAEYTNDLVKPLYNWRKHSSHFDMRKQRSSNGRYGFGKGTEDRQSMEAIKEMMMHAWQPYKKNALGFDDYKPLNKSGGSWMCESGKIGLGATLIDALTTLHIMGFDEEFRIGSEYFLKHIDVTPNGSCNVFETIIRVLGGLNSVHALTNDVRFLNKAALLADAMLPAFNSHSKEIPINSVNFKTGVVSNDAYTCLAAIGSNLLEFAYLSHVTDRSIYLDTADRAINHIVSLKKPNSPYHVNYNAFIGIPDSVNPLMSIGPDADSWYEYLLKGSLLFLSDSTKTAHYRGLYDEALDLLLNYIVVNSADGLNLGNGYFGSSVKNELQHLTCFAGGMLMLGAVTSNSPFNNQMFQIGIDYTETCNKMYHTWAPQLPPDTVELPGFTQRSSGGGYNLRPEVAESIFYAWRLTHDPKYRRWAMDIAKTINSTVRISEGGFVSLYSVSNGIKKDTQESFFVGETLKYLYLTFTDDDVIPLEKWVFNTEAHPIPRF